MSTQRVPIKLLLPVAIVSLSLGNSLAAQVPTSSSNASPLPNGCQPNTASLSPAEAALYKEDFDRAAKLYRDGGRSIESQSGLVRALLGQEKTDDALKLAQSLAAQNTGNALAQEIAGEAYVRSGEMALAPDPLATALRLDPCLGRAHYAEGRLLALSGYHASAAHQFAIAHALAPNDMQATVAWITSLPQKQNGQMLKTFLDQNEYRSSEHKEDLQDEIAISDARVAAPTTVRVTSLPASIKLFLGPQHGPNPGINSVDVNINGHARRLAFDVSGRGIRVNRAAGEALGLKPVVHSTFSQPYTAGRIQFFLAIATSIQIGGVEYKNFPVMVFDEDYGPTRNTEGVDGAFSLGALSDFLVHVDYAHQQIKLSALPVAPDGVDENGLRPWSSVSAGTESASRNGNQWGNCNPTISPGMNAWTRFFPEETQLLLLTKFGAGPERLFVLDMNALHPRLSTTAQNEISTLSKSGVLVSGSNYSGNFMKFAGLIIPINSWVVERFDNASERADLEFSGLIDQSSLIKVPFTIDYRDQLIHFETGAQPR